MIYTMISKIFAALSVILAVNVTVAFGQENYVSRRPAPQDRLFVSEAVEREIDRVSARIQDPKLRWMFINCFPNTLSISRSTASLTKSLSCGAGRLET